jgi:hypothetical protein
MTQTAVEWFNQQLVDRQNGKGDSRSWDEILKEAKEMFQEQIEEAWKDGEFTGRNGGFLSLNEEQYYEETYNKKTEEEPKPRPEVYYAGWVGLFQNRTDI